MKELIEAANQLTWPGAFAVVGCALAAAGAVWAWAWMCKD